MATLISRNRAVAFCTSSIKGTEFFLGGREYATPAVRQAIAMPSNSKVQAPRKMGLFKISMLLSRPAAARLPVEIGVQDANLGDAPDGKFAAAGSAADRLRRRSVI